MRSLSYEHGFYLDKSACTQAGPAGGGRQGVYQGCVPVGDVVASQPQVLHWSRVGCPLLQTSDASALPSKQAPPGFGRLFWRHSEGAIMCAWLTKCANPP